MNQIKAVFATIFFVLAMLLAVQNEAVLSKPLAFGLNWPTALAFLLELPLYTVVIALFLVGFGLISLFSLREHLAQRRLLRGLRGQIQALEHELQPLPTSPASQSAQVSALMDSSSQWPLESQTHLQTEMEQTMDSTTATPIAESPSAQLKDEDEILVRPSAPGWGAVIFLAAALALVVSGGVYIALNERLVQFTTQLDDVSSLAGHLSSAQQEMNRSWEQERVVVREEIGALEQSHAVLLRELGTLEEQVQALRRLPEEVRRRLVAGFLRDTAGRAAFLGSQVEGEQQRETLQDIHERLEALALELEGGSSESSGGE